MTKKLEDIPEVQIPLDKEGSVFILLGGLNGKYYLYSDSLSSSHKGCYTEGFLRYLKREGIRSSEILSGHFPIGGGKISVDKEKGIIRAYGKSDDYGKFDVNIVRRLLEDKFKGFTIIID